MVSVLILCYIVIKYNITVTSPHAIYVGIVNMFSTVLKNTINKTITIMIVNKLMYYVLCIEKNRSYYWSGNNFNYINFKIAICFVSLTNYILLLHLLSYLYYINPHGYLCMLWQYVLYIALYYWLVPYPYDTMECNKRMKDEGLVK